MRFLLEYRIVALTNISGTPLLKGRICLVHLETFEKRPLLLSEA